MFTSFWRLLNHLWSNEHLLQNTAVKCRVFMRDNFPRQPKLHGAVKRNAVCSSHCCISVSHIAQSHEQKINFIFLFPFVSISSQSFDRKFYLLNLVHADTEKSQMSPKRTRGGEREKLPTANVIKIHSKRIRNFIHFNKCRFCCHFVRCACVCVSRIDRSNWIPIDVRLTEVYILASSNKLNNYIHIRADFLFRCSLVHFQYRNQCLCATWTRREDSTVMQLYFIYWRDAFVLQARTSAAIFIYIW